MSVDFSKYAAFYFMCEGTAEEDVLDLLRREKRLCLPEDRCFFEHGGTRTQSGKERLIRDILSQDFDGPVAVPYIHDSIHERWKVRKPLAALMKLREIEILNIITAPEIEVLYIISRRDLFQRWNRGIKEKPSDFCKRVLKRSDLKRRGVFIGLFDSTDDLISACREYRSHHVIKGQLTLADLIS